MYVYDILDRFDLKSKLFCITTDNATNNDTLTGALNVRLEDEDTIQFDPSEQHIPCLAHILNLAVQSFLRNLKVLDDDTDSASDDEDLGDNRLTDPERDFAVTMFKIRQITKV